MRTVIAALDASAAARPVVETALGLGALTGATVQAVHVGDGQIEIPEWLAAQSGVSLRVLDGAVEPSLLRTIGEKEVIAAVFGARSAPGGRRPAGRTAMHVLERATKPIVIVAPDAVGVSARPIHRLLVPLEGTTESSRPILEGLCPLIVGDIELVVLHVFTSATVPRTLDRSDRDLALWGDEFMARFCPPAVTIELRTGPIAGEVAKVSAERAVDLVVLSWSRDISPGHATVIRDVLAGATVPVLLLPVNGSIEPVSARR